jgi:PDZ domain/Aspartyl protease
MEVGSMHSFVLRLLALVACTGPVWAVEMVPTAASVLRAYQAAVGPIPSSGSVNIHYDYSGYGLEGHRDDIADLRTGAYVEATQGDIVGEAKGFDGRIPWMRDTSGANTPQQGGDRIAVAINEAYRLANLWWRPGYAGAAVTYNGRETVDGKALDHLTVTPKGGKPFGAWFDPNTHLLVEITEERQFFHTRTWLSEYRPEKAVAVAHAITIDNGSGEANYEKLRLTSFQIAEPRPLQDFSCPTTPPTGGSIDGGAASVTLPFRLLNNHIYVTGTVNGKGPYTFIVDTGGHTLISPHLAAEAGLKVIGAAAMSGAGDKTAQSGFTHVDEIALGAARLRNQLGFTAEVYEPAIEGIRVDAMVGFELFRRFAVQIDYGAQTLTITDPARFQPVDLGTAIPFVFYDHLPMVTGLIDDYPARFDIDTGSRSELDITSPSVSAHHLRERFPKGVHAVTGWGVGGPGRSYVIRLPSITLNGARENVRVEQPVAGLSENQGGSISDPNYDGNIGSGLLKRFVVTFDYAHQTMYLKPAKPVALDVGQFDRSGMWINASPQGYAVTDITPGGPAARAGIRIGDTITAVNGVAARFDGLADLRLLLRSQPAGSKVRMELRRNGAVQKVTLTLADQI